jgi:hypothetical protein
MGTADSGRDGRCRYAGILPSSPWPVKVAGHGPCGSAWKTADSARFVAAIARPNRYRGGQEGRQSRS